MKVLSIINTKGGVGKTVTTVHLGAALAASGLRVLLLDCDLQHNLTSYFRVQAEPGATVADVLLNDLALEDAAIEVRESLHLIPSTSATAEADAQLAAASGGEVRLRRAVYRQAQEDPDRWDIALIDCPAGWSSVSRNAVLASQYLIVPVNCEPAAFHCAGATIAGANELCEYHLHRLEAAWVLLTRRRDTRVARDVCALAEATWGKNVLDARIRHAERINELAVGGKAVGDVSRAIGGGALDDYEALAEEVILRGKTQGA